MHQNRFFFLLFCLMFMCSNCSFAQQTNGFNNNVIKMTAINATSFVKLSWHLTTETEAGFFIIERGADTLSFADIARITAINKTGSNYFFIDDRPLKGASYYRINMIDATGKTTTGKTFETYINTGKVTVYPSPATSVLHVQHCPIAKPNATLTITNILGKPVKQLVLQQMATAVTVDVAGLTTGVYILCINDNGIRTTTRFLKN